MLRLGAALCSALLLATAPAHAASAADLLTMDGAHVPVPAQLIGLGALALAWMRRQTRPAH